MKICKFHFVKKWWWQSPPLSKVVVTSHHRHIQSCAYNPRPRWGSLHRSRDPLAGFKGTGSRRGGEREGRETKGRKDEGKEGEGQEGRGRGGEGDCDAQLEQSRRLDKTGPANRR